MTGRGAKACSYGTIIVDLERRRVVDLLVHIRRALDEKFRRQLEIANRQAQRPQMQTMESGLKIGAEIEVQGLLDRSRQHKFSGLSADRPVFEPCVGDANRGSHGVDAVA